MDIMKDVIDVIKDVINIITDFISVITHFPSHVDRNKDVFSVFKPDIKPIEASLEAI